MSIFQERIGIKKHFKHKCLLLDIISDTTTHFAPAFHKLQRIKHFINFEIETYR